MSEVKSNAGTKSLKVLVVEDHEPSAHMLEWAIGSFGADVKVCLDGGCAIDTAREFVPDVMLLDLELPGIDGLAVCRTLRSDPDLVGMKVIAQTGRDTPSDKMATADAGFDFHLVKPIDLVRLGDILQLLKGTALQ